MESLKLTLNDVPHELLPLMFKTHPHLSISKVTYPTEELIKFIKEMMGSNEIYCDFDINGEITYVNHFIGFHIRVTGTNSENFVNTLTSRIDDFLNKINNNIASELYLHYSDPKYTKKSQRTVEQNDDFINVLRLTDEIEYNTYIKYTGNNYIINNIILAKDGYYFICDLLNFIKTVLYFPDKN